MVPEAVLVGVSWSLVASCVGVAATVDVVGVIPKKKRQAYKIPEMRIRI